jgi:hypothetical protein
MPLFAVLVVFTLGVAVATTPYLAVPFVYTRIQNDRQTRPTASDEIEPRPRRSPRFSGSARGPVWCRSDWSR